MSVSTLLDSVMDLGSAAEGLLDKKSLFDTAGGWRVLQAIVRQISVPLRKLCLDSEGALLKKAVPSPTFHPLGGRKGRYRRATMAWRSERRKWVLGYANGKKKTVVVPETKHEIEIGRLYGVDFLDGGWCAIHSPFDLTARPVPLAAWLDAKALQVNSVSYTVRDALKLVADYEGAHTNELPAWVAVGVNPEDIDKGRNMKYRLVNSVYFDVCRMCMSLFFMRACTSRKKCSSSLPSPPIRLKAWMPLLSSARFGRFAPTSFFALPSSTQP